MHTVTIANSSFIKHTPSARIGGTALGDAPTHFRWEFAGPESARFVTDEFIGQARGTGQVAWLIEPFFLHPETYVAALSKPFDYVLTHEQSFVENRENWLWIPAGGSWINKEDWGVWPKTQSVSLLLSDKQMTYGHRLRYAMRTRYGAQVDVLGLDYRVTPFEAYGPYRYSIIVENEKSRTWFTEKLIDCLSVGTVPIYWGAPDIDRFFDASGIITFDTLWGVDSILKTLSERDYADRMVAICGNLEEACQYRIVEDQMFTRYHFLFEGAE